MGKVFVETLPFNDVEVSGSILFDQRRGAGERQGTKRGVRVPSSSPVFSKFHGLECSASFRSMLEREGVSKAEKAEEQGWVVGGPSMLMLAYDPHLKFTVSVEAASLLHLVRVRATSLLRKRPKKTRDRDLIPGFEVESRDGMCFFAQLGPVRGAVAEFRFWQALWLHFVVPDKLEFMNSGNSFYIPRASFEGTLSTVRGWYDEKLLSDFVDCAGEELVEKMLRVVALNGYSGSPDLVLWSEGYVEFAEIKSSKDALKPDQRKCLSDLSRFAPTGVWHTKNASKLSSIREAEKSSSEGWEDTDDSEASL